MNTSFTSTMFESIKDALKKDKSSGGFKDFLKLEIDPKPYIVRLIPNIKDPEKTFFHYFSHGWQSLATGQFVSAVSPTTWGERDPIAEERFKLYKQLGENATEKEKKKVALLNRKENWLAKVFVVSDPKHPENNGKVKILRFGRQLHKIIMAAIDGEDAEEFGAKVFDFTANGCNLKIKAEQQGEYISFVTSKFASPSEIPGMTPEKMQEVYGDAIDLEKVYQVKSYKELQEMLQEHFYGLVDGKAVNKDEAPATASSHPAQTNKTVEEDDIPMGTISQPAANQEVLDDAQVKELLKGLE